MVDDVAENRALLVQSLERVGFDVYPAVCGYDGLAQAQALLPDLVLMDIVMPDIGGLEVIRRLRKLPVLDTVPIIAISASATPEVEANTITAGADAFLAKPVDLKALMARTASLLNLAWVEGAERSGRVAA